MELRHLRYFVVVAAEENITRAAARLHVSQPPLSRQLRDLERELGVSLFARNAKGVRLTEAGQLFLGEAQSLLKRTDDAVELVRAVARGKQGKVRVGHASPTIEVLQRALRAFSASHPHVGVDLREMTSKAMLRGLHDRSLDVALTVSHSPRDFDGLKVEPLGAYAVRVAMSKKHPFARLRDVPLRAVAREPLVFFTRAEHPEAYAGLRKILAPFTDTPQIVEEYDSFGSLMAAVEAGRGIALVHESLALIAGRRLVLRPVTPAPPLLPIAVAYRHEDVSAPVAAFVAATRAARHLRSRASRPVLSL
jgi:DNA-binding transcriptional LysR family regulator